MNAEKLKAYPLRSATRQDVPLPLLLNIVLEVLTTTNREEKKLRESKLEKKLNHHQPKDMILYIEDSKDATQHY